jgi:hypothetical protein
MSSAAKQQYPIFLFFSISIITLLLLSALNIKNFLTPKVVLGIEDINLINEDYWREFLEKNPDYIPGWIELGRFDKVKQIDPNYPLP